MTRARTHGFPGARDPSSLTLAPVRPATYPCCVTTPLIPGDRTPVGEVTLSGLVANRYRIERQIGEGGMATVYLAWDQTREVQIALKAPKPELVMQLGADRFAREIQISTKLQHPHIVPVLDAGVTESGVPFYVMPFIDGETLEQRLKRDGALPVDEAIDIACQVLDGLIYAHGIGFVHRDVKPSNVLLSHGHALLADFGIARAVERTDNRKLTESGFALGTAEYMSPEQAAGESQLDGRSDIYSLACVLYEMLVGGPPFTAPTARAVMARHFVDPVPSIRTVRDTVPVKLEQAVMTALAKTPVDRFADAAAFKSALRDPALRESTATTRSNIATWESRAADRWWRDGTRAAGRRLGLAQPRHRRRGARHESCHGLSVRRAIKRERREQDGRRCGDDHRQRAGRRRPAPLDRRLVVAGQGSAHRHSRVDTRRRAAACPFASVRNLHDRTSRTRG